MHCKLAKQRSLAQLVGLVLALVSLRQVASPQAFVQGLAGRQALGTTAQTASPRPGQGLYDAARPSVTRVLLRAAKKSKGETIMHGDTIYIKVMTGRYVGELDGTTKLEWVKARGTKKDKEHALTIEKMNNRDEPIKNGDVVMFVMPQGVHMDVLGSAVRARYYDPRGEWQKITIVKQDGGEIYSGDQIFLRGHQGEYLDANPLERAPDGEVKARWRDEGEWQVMWIEK
mmetsp:Transcript_62545/g.117004  ORF Transcript_62545/g.117004 Transcript_62545/m.117004 type:complete len:229 (+) Transcript_62545:57-743(+)